jgi:hypothetical protein
MSAPRHQYVVRVVLHVGLRQDDALLGGPFIACLRYAGLVVFHRTDETGACFDLVAPRGVHDTHAWAKHNADRMASFGYNAVAAPAWPAERKPAGPDVPDGISVRDIIGEVMTELDARTGDPDEWQVDAMRAEAAAEAMRADAAAVGGKCECGHGAERHAPPGCAHPRCACDQFVPFVRGRARR